MEKSAVISSTLSFERASGAADAQAWRTSAPVLRAGGVILREVRLSDAPALWSLLRAPEVTRFISAPPATIDGFERFIESSQRLRADGEGACFAITIEGSDSAIGIFQVRQTGPSLTPTHSSAEARDTAEWGFAIGAPYWGAGVFRRGAPLLIDFAFEELGVRRLEARAAALNNRGNSALQNMGAVPEGILRNALVCDEGCVDQVLYSIHASEWQLRRDYTYRGATTWIH